MNGKPEDFASEKVEMFSIQIGKALRLEKILTRDWKKPAH